MRFKWKLLSPSQLNLFDIVTHRTIARQRLSKHPRQRIRNNRGYTLLGNGSLFRVFQPEAIQREAKNYLPSVGGLVWSEVECPVEDIDL
jgi:hypothetical protein